jgi:hypothetical protein
MPVIIIFIITDRIIVASVAIGLIIVIISISRIRSVSRCTRRLFYGSTDVRTRTRIFYQVCSVISFSRIGNDINMSFRF